jgi:hypothetical protein
MALGEVDMRNKRYPELEVSVFVVPAAIVKNKQDRLIVLNDVATKVIDSRRGRHKTHVFTFRSLPVRRLHNTAWRHARDKAELPTLRVHDLKHTFGRRLRAAGVSFEDHQDLLGHKSGRITTHYCAAEIGNLIAAANQVTRSGKTPEAAAERMQPNPFLFVSRTRAGTLRYTQIAISTAATSALFPGFDLINAPGS